MKQTPPEWQRLVAAARRRIDDREVSAPYGFATRVAALALAAERPVASLFERFSLRAMSVAALLSRQEDFPRAIDILKDAIKAKPKEPAAPISLGGRVDHMLATGAVVIDQPGRKATGEKLTYTASDQVFVLTGTKAAPPKMVDDLQGATTGAAGVAGRAT